MPTPEGFATLFLAGFLFLLATNLMAGWLFFLVAFLVALLAVGLLSAAGGARAVRVEAGGLVRTVEGGEVTLPVLVEGLRAVRFVRIAAAVGGRRGEIFVPVIRRGERLQTTLRLPAPARGAYPLEHLEVLSHGLVGMFRVRRQSPAGGEVLVRPRFTPLAALPGEPGPEGAGVLAGRRRGGELVGTREYLPGDPTRHIHWRSSRRHRRLIVKEFDEPIAPATAIVMDGEAGQDREALNQAVRAAASLAFTSIQRGRQVVLLCVDRRGPVVIQGPWEQVWDGLARLAADGPSLPQALSRLAPLLSSGVTPIVVTTRSQQIVPGAILVGPAGTEAPWEFNAEGEVRRRWRA